MTYSNIKIALLTGYQSFMLLARYSSIVFEKIMVLLHSLHSKKRSQQRGISAKMITDTVTHGKKIHKQGLRYYFMLRKCVPLDFEPVYIDKLLNTVVILDQFDQIITTYKNRKGHRHIMKKNKKLNK